MADTISTRKNTRSGNAKRPIRQRPLPPDVNTRNLAIEKQRREALNENFLVGADHSVPFIPHRTQAEDLLPGSGSLDTGSGFRTTAHKGAHCERSHPTSPRTEHHMHCCCTRHAPSAG